GADLEAVQLREGDEIRQPRHRAIVVHDLADHARRVQTGETRNVDGRLRVARAYERTAVPGDKGENVARHDDVVRSLCRIDRHGNRVRAVVRGDSRRHAFLRLD